MLRKAHSLMVVAAAVAGALGLMAPRAQASLVVTPVSAAGTYSYNYSPFDGVSVNGGTPSGTSTAIPTAANPSSSDLYVQTNFVASGTYGVSNSTTNSDTMTWDFQTAPGLAFGSGFSISAGGVNNDVGSTMTGAYSTDGGSSYTQFYNNSGPASLNAGVVDYTNSVSVNLSGVTNLLVQFTIKDSVANQIAFFWGGSDPMNRAFILSGNVVATPEPASLSLFGAAAAGLLLVARKRKTA